MLENVTNFNSPFAVDPPSDLNFKIIDENTVHMSWERPSDPIVGYRITVDSTTGEFWDFGTNIKIVQSVCLTSYLITRRISISKPEGLGWCHLVFGVLRATESNPHTYCKQNKAKQNLFQMFCCVIRSVKHIALTICIGFYLYWR